MPNKKVRACFIILIYRKEREKKDKLLALVLYISIEVNNG